MTIRTILICSLVATGCLDSEPDAPVDVVSHGAYLNGAYLNGAYLNGLLGTAENIKEFIGHPLRSESYDASTGSAVLAVQLEDPNSQEFMAYTVSCALEPAQSVKWKAADGEEFSWNGAIGMCPEWHTGLPSVACQERVSACLLARQNPLGHHVLLSLRGEKSNGTAIALDSRVKVKSISIVGDVIASTEPCFGGLGANCGWSNKESYVGACATGANVEIKCSTSNGTQVRVCNGVEACDAGDEVASLTCNGGKVAAVDSFACGSKGSFAVMVRNPTGSVRRPTTSANAVFTASEALILSHNEGAFGGNIFDAAKRNPALTRYVDPWTLRVVHQNLGFVPGDPLYRDAYSCVGGNYAQAEALADHRLCAVLPVGIAAIEICLAASLGLCEDVCLVDDQGPVLGDHDFDLCIDANDTKRTHWITTFLDDPCDTVAPGTSNPSANFCNVPDLL